MDGRSVFRDAEWIWRDAEDDPDEYAEFRIAFDADPCGRYEFHLACDSDYALRREGEIVAFGQYPDFPDHRIYDSIPLPDLEKGLCEFSLTVWHQGVEDASTYIKKPAGVVFAVTRDGEPVLSSSPGIPSREAAGYIPHLAKRITGQLGFSFSYDAERPAGSWAASRPAEGPGELFPRPVRKLLLLPREHAPIVLSGSFSWKGGMTPGERMQRAALSASADGRIPDEASPAVLTKAEGSDGIFLIVDMGRETAGFPELVFRTDEPCLVTGGWGEHLSDGRCRTRIGERDFSFTYRAKRGENRFLHPFRRLGGRYLELFFETDSVSLSHASLRETRYPIQVLWKPAGDPLRDRIAEVSINTLRQCMHEHYEDCPWREQALYTMDSRNQMLSGYAAFGETAFPRASLDLISQSMREDGLLSICAPAGTDLAIPSFSLVYFLQMREYLAYAKDADFLREKYPFLRRLMETFLRRRREDGLIPCFEGTNSWNFYEWSEGMEGNLRGSDASTVDSPLNAFFSLALAALGEIADELGESEDAVFYREAARKVNDALRETFFDPETGLFRSFSDRRQEEFSVLTNSLCLLSGAADGLPQGPILALLADGTVKEGFRAIPCTLSMNCFRFDSLLKADRKTYAPRILDELDRTYLAMLEKGATSFWETVRGEADFGGAGSLCHGWSALPLYYYALLGGEGEKEGAGAAE